MTIDNFFFFKCITQVYWPSKYQSKGNQRTVLLLATIFFFNKINITQVYWPSWPSTIFFFFKCITQVYWPSKYQSKDNQRTVLLLATIFFFYKINITQVYWPSWPSTIYLKKYITHVYWPSKYQSKDNHRTVLLLATIFFIIKLILRKCIDHHDHRQFFFFLNVLHTFIDHRNIKAKTITEQCFLLRRFFFLIK